MSEDIIYYNISIGNNDPTLAGNLNLNESNPGFILSSVVANNNQPIIQNPSEYYCSIIRFSISGYNFPVAYPIIQTPILDINKTVYSFTLSYQNFNSAQTFMEFIPEVTISPYKIPVIGTATQTFNEYYNIFDYTSMVTMFNNTLKAATASLNTIASNTFTAPFFFYDATTQLISLYTKPGQFDGNDVVSIYFNNPFALYFVGLPFTSIYNGATLDPNGKDNKIIIQNNIINFITINTVNYIKSSYDFNAYGYWNGIKSILITTQMAVVSEIFFINNPSGLQNTSYVNVLTDYIPDLSQPNGAGLAQQIYAYNADSLYRVFEFKQSKPLYAVSLQVNYLDQYNNLFPVTTDKGISHSFKLMFIKKSIYNTMSLKALKIN